MFRKLLKHDFKAVFRYWWLLLPSVPILMLLVGFSIRFINRSSYAAAGDTESFLSAILMILLTIFLIFAIILISASALVTPILCLIRFYKHFFTDEGYLTFTLPVKRSTLLLSKVVNAMIFNVMYVILMVVGVFLAFLAVEPKIISSFFQGVTLIIREIPIEFSGWLFLYLFEGILLLFAMNLFSTMLLYFSVTIGALIVKKAKLVVGLAIYYGVNWALSGVTQVLTYAVLPASINEIGNLLLGMSGHAIFGSFAFIFLVSTACAFTLSFTLYSMTLGRLERNLNLS